MFCPTCGKCPQCCTKSACRGQTSKLLENLAKSRGRSEGSSNPARGLPPPLPDPAPTNKVPYSHKPLCQSPQEQLPAGGITSAYRQKRSGKGSKSQISRVFQPTISSPKTQQQMEANTGPKQTKPFPQGGKVQNGDTGNHQNIPPTRGVGHLSGLQRCLLSHTDTGTIQEIPAISCPGPDLSVQSTALWSVHSAHGVHCVSKRSETDGHTPWYKDPPVPRRLVGESQVLSNLSPTHPKLSQNMPGTRLASESREIRTATQTGLRLCRLPVRPQVQPGPTDPGPVAKTSGQDTNTFVTTGLSGPAVHVPDRSSNSHRKAGSPRPVTHETHTVASQKQLEGPRISREDYPSTKDPAPSFTMVAKRRQCASGSTVTPSKTCAANFYRRVKRRVGRSLKRAHCKRVLVGAGKQAAHKLSGTQSSFSRLERVPGSLYRQNSSCSNRQYYSGSLHKQGRRHEVGPAVCPTLENLDLVFPATSNAKSPTHPRASKCDSRQTIQAGSDHPNRMHGPSFRRFICRSATNGTGLK